ncbi:methyltransferase domain-containing protein [Phyllobacterium bourgognense]|uniref:Glycosyl transferase family 2 n=1 Tax=Phyllobacterium bourgognense TaxID=314236 RepID=A0A368YPS2_9HYPH|nr:methyltransferase domain-containing protein [Phyllobacterium bourgognense]RCW80154.1 glycosyl transferase family 2 [Phyllobacterium bourgognense]
MITNPFHEYENEFAFDNVYGHSLELLKRNVDRSPPSDTTIHLDVGCGYGSIAEQVSFQLGRTYVGVDANNRSLASLNSRGFETHRFLLTNEEEENADFLRSVIGDRTVGSITLLDTLEHLTNSGAILSALYEIAKTHNSLVVVSVPNMLHRDIGFKLALGRLNYTESGLLDHTHVRMFDEKLLTDTLRHSGLHIIDRKDVRMNHSDQFFPPEHPVLQDATMLRSFFKNIRGKVDDQDLVNQIVVACLPGEKIKKLPFVTERETSRPFLTIVTRTQGNRIHCLTEYFTCLAAQTCRDFEVIIVGHKLSIEQQIAVERIIEDLPIWLREKTRLIRVYKGNRTHPLNVGFENAHGRYIAIQDDDDIPLGNWVEEFEKISKKHDGCLLRCVSVLQTVKTVTIGRRVGIRAISSFQKIFPSSFDFIDHLKQNQSPNNTLAFPRGVFHELNMRFDEELTTTEDWDYILRVAAVVGVGSNPVVTGIYQWFDLTNSKSEHAEHEWRVNHLRIEQKLDTGPLLMPSGSLRRILRLIDERDSLKHGIAAHPSLSFDHDITRQNVREIYAIMNSTSWKVTKPLRMSQRLLGRGAGLKFTDCLNFSSEQLEEAIRQLRNSTSWRLTRTLRRIGQILKGGQQKVS